MNKQNIIYVYFILWHTNGQNLKGTAYKMFTFSLSLKDKATIKLMLRLRLNSWLAQQPSHNPVLKKQEKKLIRIILYVLEEHQMQKSQITPHLIYHKVQQLSRQCRSIDRNVLTAKPRRELARWKPWTPGES